jgi:hypothetical protein
MSTWPNTSLATTSSGAVSDALSTFFSSVAPIADYQTFFTDLSYVLYFAMGLLLFLYIIRRV